MQRFTKPPSHPFPDRRRATSDRRGEWRGGRRDSDWLTRPAGAQIRLELPPLPLSMWRRLFSFGRA
jgi:hypothetical protein